MGLCNRLEVFFSELCRKDSKSCDYDSGFDLHTQKNVSLPIGFRGVQLEGLQDLSVLVQIIGFATHSLLQ